MKKIISLIVVSILFAACGTQATVTPTATASLTATPAPTQTPIPTPTSHPDFLALQEAIAASGERFTLDGATGLIYDGADPVPGIAVAADGTITLEIDGETITPDPEAVSFDDQGGITVEENERKLRWGENGWEMVRSVSLTWEDWQKMFDFTYIGIKGDQYDVLAKIKGYADVMTNPEAIDGLDRNAQLVILNSDGTAQCMATRQEAAKAAQGGAIVLFDRESERARDPGILCGSVLRALNRAYLEGNHNVHMSFGRNYDPERSGDFPIFAQDILTIKDANGRLIAPVLDCPFNYTLTRLTGDPNNSSERFPPSAEYKNTVYWAEEVILGEYYGITVYTQ